MPPFCHHGIPGRFRGRQIPGTGRFRHGFRVDSGDSRANSHRKCGATVPANWLESGRAATYKDAGLTGPARVALRVVWCVGRRTRLGVLSSPGGRRSRPPGGIVAAVSGVLGRPPHRSSVVWHDLFRPSNFAPVAQRIESRTSNPKVGGSNPPGRANVSLFRHGSYESGRLFARAGRGRFSPEWVSFGSVGSASRISDWTRRAFSKSSSCTDR